MAVENSVYEKLARRKRDGESFTKIIDRLIQESGTSRATCASAVEDGIRVWGAVGNDFEADKMEKTIREGRERTQWEVERLN